MTPAAAETAPRWAPFYNGAACPAPASATGFRNDEFTHKREGDLRREGFGLRSGEARFIVSAAAS